MRVYSSSASIPDPTALQEGQDLVLRLAEADASALPHGTAADDHLQPADRADLDEAAITMLASWRAQFDKPLTVEEICLPFIVEWQLMRSLMATLRPGAGLLSAVRRLRPRSLVAATDDPVTRALVDAVAASTGLPADVGPGSKARSFEAERETPQPRFSDLRRSAVGATPAPALPVSSDGQRAGAELLAAAAADRPPLGA